MFDHIFGVVLEDALEQAGVPFEDGLIFNMQSSLYWKQKEPLNFIFLLNVNNWLYADQFLHNMFD